MSFRIFQNEKTHFKAIKKRSSKSRKIDFFPERLNNGFGLKMAGFPTFILYAIQARKICFIRFQNEKTQYQAIKKRSSKSRKIDIFPKGLTHGFGPKMALFQTFIFYVIQARKMSFTIFFNKKKAFQAIKIRTSKSQKIDIFSKGLNHGFGPKMALFPTFFFGQYRPGKYLLRYSRTKKPLSRL